MNPSDFRWSTLDFKVGLRMLARYPGITVIGTVAIAVAIALGSIYFEAVDKYQNPRLPILDGHRVVSIREWDRKKAEAEPRTLHDFAVWRGHVRTVEQLGAAISFERNLFIDGGAGEPERGAEITANAFQLTRTLPLLGRAFTGEDERPGELPVVLLGHRLWTTRFQSDPGVVGRTVRLGTTTATVVGVMPEGFAFPVNQRLWVPLRLDGSLLAPRTGPSVSVFGRLAPGRSISEAQAEMDVFAAQLSAASPATHQDLRTLVTPYQKPLAEGGESLLVRNILYSINTVFLLLLAIMCTNVATLVFARTAGRSWEISVRSALGAGRGRILGQMFVEALVLSGLAAVVGLIIARTGLRLAVAASAGGRGVLPFWIDAGLSWRTFLYVSALTLAGAAIVGILPAWRVTRLSIQDALRSEGASRLTFGGFWTVVIVAQVAVTVAFLPLAGNGVFESNRFRQRAAGIGAERYLKADVALDREDYGLDSATYAARVRRSFDDLEQRLATEPGVTGVAFADRLPVEDQFKYRIEVDSTFGAPATGARLSTLVHVSRGFFRAFGTEIVAGRGFEPLDFRAGNELIVNQSFARHVLGGRNAVGQRIRIVSGEVESVGGDTWYEIVGVVKDFGWQLPRPEEQSAMYRPSTPGVGRASQLVMAVKDPAAFAARLRQVAAEVDPTIRLEDVEPLTRAGGAEAQLNWTLTAVGGFILFIVLLLSATGIHALMSFTVARRTREIGIRVALGAGGGRIVVGIFSRAFFQLAAGVVVGSGIVALLGLGSTRQVMLLLGTDALMLMVGLAACAVPVRRALRVQPTEALRAEG